MGTIRVGAVWFKSYPNDHLPPHVHGIYGETEVIVDLLEKDSSFGTQEERQTTKRESFGRS